MNLLSTLIQQQLVEVLDLPPPPERPLSKREKTVELFEEVMKGNGVFTAVTLGEALGRVPDSINKTLLKILIPDNLVVRVPAPEGMRETQAYFYKWKD